MEQKEYCGKVPTCFEKRAPFCPAVAVIPTTTVESKTGVQGLANCLVRVTENNTTYYVDDKHRVTTVCANPVTKNGYDFENNPDRFRNQIVFDLANQKAAYYSAEGDMYLIAPGHPSFDSLVDRPSYDNQIMTSATNIPKVPENVSELTNDSDYQTGTQVAASIAVETGLREAADNGLQNQIDALASSSDVVDVVGTYAELLAYDTSKLNNNDIVKVLSDSTHNDAISYYRWNTTVIPNVWVYIGSQGPFYTKSETDTLLNGYVPNTRTVNSKALSSNVTLTGADINMTVNGVTSTINDYGTTTNAALDQRVQTADLKVPVTTQTLSSAQKTSTQEWAGLKVLTQQEYDDLVTKDGGTIYFVKEA